MTTYQAISDESEYHLIAFWHDLLELTTHHVTTFQELKLAKAARAVLDAASRSVP